MDHALLSPSAALDLRRVRVWIVFAAALAGLALCVTAMFTGMREVMGVGGACASGGPYEVAVPCPDGVAVLLVPAMPLGFAFAGLVAWTGSRIGRGAGGLALLAWPALFLSLGWNFLEYGLDPVGGGAADISLLLCASLFFLMGALPLGALPGAIRRLEHRAAVVGVALAAGTAGVAGGLALTAAVTGG